MSKKIAITLTDLQRRFCHEYVKDLDRARACMRSGYKVTNLNSAYVQGSNLLKNTKVCEYLGELLNLSDISVISEIVKIAFASITDVISYEQGALKIKDTSRWSARAVASVKSIKVTETEFNGTITRSTTVTMHDKMSALDKLMRRLRLYPKDVAVLEAMQVLLTEGVATPEQASAVIDGITEIQDKLKAANNN